MRTIINTVLVFLLATLFVACKEEKTDAYVEGVVIVNGDETKFGGSLAKSGADYEGRCTIDDTSIKFSLTHNVDDLFLNVTATDLEVHDGVFESSDSDDTFSGDEFEQPFEDISLRKVTPWSISYDEENEACRIKLFAMPKPEERMPGSGKAFDYYLDIGCSNLADEDNLNSFDIRLFFDNCD